MTAALVTPGDENVAAAGLERVLQNEPTTAEVSQNQVTAIYFRKNTDDRCTGHSQKMKM